MPHESTPPPRQGPGGGEIAKRANASRRTYQNPYGISSPQVSNDNGSIPIPLLRAAVSWLFVAGLITEAAHDAAWRALERFA